MATNLFSFRQHIKSIGKSVWCKKTIFKALTHLLYSLFKCVTTGCQYMTNWRLISVSPSYSRIHLMMRFNWHWHWKGDRHGGEIKSKYDGVFRWLKEFPGSDCGIRCWPIFMENYLGRGWCLALIRYYIEVVADPLSDFFPIKPWRTQRNRSIKW